MNSCNYCQGEASVWRTDTAVCITWLSSRREFQELAAFCLNKLRVSLQYHVPKRCDAESTEQASWCVLLNGGRQWIPTSLEEQ